MNVFGRTIQHALAVGAAVMAMTTAAGAVTTGAADGGEEQYALSGATTLTVGDTATYGLDLALKPPADHPDGRPGYTGYQFTNLKIRWSDGVEQVVETVPWNRPSLEGEPVFFETIFDRIEFSRSFADAGTYDLMVMGSLDFFERGRVERCDFFGCRVEEFFRPVRTDDFARSLTVTVNPEITAVPLPAGLPLMIGAIGMLAAARRFGGKAL